MGFVYDNPERRGSTLSEMTTRKDEETTKTTRKDGDEREIAMLLENERYLDLQLFAKKEEELPGVTDDDPEFEDDDDDDDDVEDLDDDDDDVDLHGEMRKIADKRQSVADVDDDDPDEPDEDEEAVEGDEDEEETEEAEETSEKLYTKAELDAAKEQAVNERFLRDRRRIASKQLEDLTGMDMENLVKLAQKNRQDAEIQKLADDRGWTEEEARDYYFKDNQARQASTQVDTMSHTVKAQQYEIDKYQHLNNPLVKRYEKEIDEFSGRGEMCTFEAARRYILGLKLEQGEITSDLQSGAEKKALANMKKKGKARVEKGSQGGKSAASASVKGLSPEQREWAANFGLSPKEVAAEQKKMTAERAGRSKR